MPRAECSVCVDGESAAAAAAVGLRCDGVVWLAEEEDVVGLARRPDEDVVEVVFKVEDAWDDGV